MRGNAGAITTNSTIRAAEVRGIRSRLAVGGAAHQYELDGYLMKDVDRAPKPFDSAQMIVWCE
jgi:hypothetical protein